MSVETLKSIKANVGDEPALQTIAYSRMHNLNKRKILHSITQRSTRFGKSNHKLMISEICFRSIAKFSLFTELKTARVAQNLH